MRFAASIRRSAAIVLGSLSFGALPAQADTPLTLFEMARAKAEPARLSNSVLVIVDAQREYVDGALPLAGVNEAIGEIGALLARARRAETPVIHVVHRGKGALFNPNGTSFRIVVPLQPREGERVVEKTRISAFADTGLEEAIRRSGRRNLIIVGFMTHNCVSTTARAAMDKGYAPTIVAAATATRDLPDGKGGVITASVLQAASLAALADRTATVVFTETDIPE